MIQFGMPTLLELDGLEANAKLCQELGLGFVEINMNMPEFQVEELNASLLREMMEKYGVYFTFHMADNLDIANFQKEVRDVNVDLVKRTLELAESIKSPIVNMHMQRGVLFTLPTKKVYIYGKYLDRYMTYIDEFAEMVDQVLANKQVKLVVENTGDFNLDFIKHSSQKLIDHDKIGMTYDIGHDYSSFGNDKEFIIENLSKIRHMHIHDAIGVDHHLALGSGQMQLERYIGFARNYDIRCVIEAKTLEALTESVKVLPSYLQRF